MAETLGLDPAQIPDNAEMNSLEKWDSLGQIELMLALEMKFGVTMSTQDVLDLTTLEAIEQFIGERTRAAA